MPFALQGVVAYNWLFVQFFELMKPDTSAGQAPKLLTQLAEAIRSQHYSIRTAEAHVHWSKAFIRFIGLRRRFARDVELNYQYESCSRVSFIYFMTKQS